MTAELAPPRPPVERSGLQVTRPVPRAIALLAFGVILACVVYFRGSPQDQFSIFAWLWLLSVAWNIEAPPVKHLSFVKDWSLPLVLLTVYVLSGGIADNLGMEVHFSYPIEFDTWMAGGDTPSAQLQSLLCGNPCDPSGVRAWYDRIFVLVWMTHFTVGLAVAVGFWLRARHEFVRWMRRYLAINGAALVGYVLVPTAPPWMASQAGLLPTEVHRLTATAWVGPRPEAAGGADGSSWAGNAVAAMPSLHAGVAFLVALYGIQRLSSTWRFLLLLYPLAMSFALVYLGEHYVADILAGAALAAVVLAVSSAWERWRSRQDLFEAARSTVDAGAR